MHNLFFWDIGNCQSLNFCLNLVLQLSLLLYIVYYVWPGSKVHSIKSVPLNPN